MGTAVYFSWLTDRLTPTVQLAAQSAASVQLMSSTEHAAQ